MRSRVASWCAVVTALAAVGFVPACVRLNEPDVFVCEVNEDCTADEHCGSAGRCLEAGQCDSSADCPSNQGCQDLRCVPACDPLNTVACGGFRCDTASRACLQQCSYDGDCRDGYSCETSARTCRPAVNLADGRACTAPEQCAARKCCARPGVTGMRCSVECIF